MTYTVLCNRDNEAYEGLPSGDNVVVYFKMVASPRYKDEEWSNAIIIENYKDLSRDKLIAEITAHFDKMSRLYSGVINGLSGIEEKEA